MDRSGGRGGVGTAITNTLESSAQGGGKPEGVVIETEGRKTFKSRRVVNHVKSCRAAGCDEDKKVSIEFSNNEVIDFGQRGFQPNEEWWPILWKLKGVGGRGQVWLLCRMGQPDWCLPVSSVASLLGKVPRKHMQIERD